MADGRLFSVGGRARLYIARQNSRPPPSSALLRPCASLRVQVRSARRLSSPRRPRWARPIRQREAPMTTDHEDTGHEPPHASSPTDHVLDELQLYGYRPFQDEPDPRPLPEAKIVAGAVADIFDALVVTLGRHPPRTRPRRSALVDRQRLPSRHEPDRTRTRRQRAGAAAQPEGTGWLGNPLGRVGAPHGRGPDADRAPEQHGILPRPGRRPIRAPHHSVLAAARGLEGQPPHADCVNDR